MLNRVLAALRGDSSAAGADAELNPLLEDIARPISGESPCGADVSYDSDFLRLKEEIDKLNAIDTRVDQERAAEMGRQLRNGRAASAGDENERSVRGSAKLDADFVVDSAHAILRDKSKDLRVASYLALGLARRDGFAGVADAVTALDLLVESFWDGLFPPVKRMTARKSAMDVGVRWILESLEGVSATEDDRGEIERAREATSSLTSAFSARELPDIVLQLGVLDARLAECIGRIPAVVVPSAEVVAPAVAPTPPESRVPELQMPATTTTLPQSGVQAAEMIVRAASWFRQDDARRVISYRVARSLRWDALAAEPPNQDGKTAIEAPPTARRDYLSALHQRGEWENLVREAEQSFGQPPFHFWLDLQRLVVDGLTNLGAEYSLVRGAVVQELLLVVSRIPSLPSLVFADGRTRFADAATVAWLQEISKERATPAAGSTVIPSASSGVIPSGVRDRSLPGVIPSVARDRYTSAANLATRFAEPRKRLNDGDLAGALGMMQRAASEDASHHDRFLRRLYSATMCIEAGQLSVARVILEELDGDIDTHRLDRWDPPLALDVWTRLYACYATQAARAGRGVDVQQIGRDMQRVFARICRVDTTRALVAAQEVGHPKS